MTEIEKLNNKINFLREKRIKDKKKYKEQQRNITQMKREILQKMKELEEQIKDIMYLGGKK